jgi:hypothetical protein
LKDAFDDIEAVRTMVSDTAPSAGFHNSTPPTTMDKRAVTRVHKKPGTLRAENMAMSLSTKPGAATASTPRMSSC